MVSLMYMLGYLTGWIWGNSISLLIIALIVLGIYWIFRMVKNKSKEEKVGKKDMEKYPLRKFYLWSWLVLSIIMSGLYIFSGAVEGYVYPVFLEILFAGVFAIIPTLIYFIFNH